MLIYATSDYMGSYYLFPNTFNTPFIATSAENVWPEGAREAEIYGGPHGTTVKPVVICLHPNLGAWASYISSTYTAQPVNH